MKYLITVLIAVIISCGITLGHHFIYVGPADEILAENIKDNATDIHTLADNQVANQRNISEALDFLTALQSSLLLNTVDYRVKVGKAFKEVIVNFEGAQSRIKTLERRHLEVIRALAVLQKKHWDPAKAAEASGLD